MYDKTKEQNLKIGAVVSLQDVKYINTLVGNGEYINRSDFVREAIRDKIRSIKERRTEQ